MDIDTWNKECLRILEESVCSPSTLMRELADSFDQPDYHVTRTYMYIFKKILFSKDGDHYTEVYFCGLCLYRKVASRVRQATD